MKVGLFIAILGTLSVGGGIAKPISDEDCNRKGKYYRVNCADQLQFMHPKATCYMNDNGDFFVMTLDKNPMPDVWTEAPLDGQEEGDFKVVNAGAVVVAEESQTTEKQNINAVEAEKPKQDNSGLFLLALLAIGIMAG